jgi:ABC-type glycerol-3-phosphate transport system substrate-binding protein
MRRRHAAALAITPLLAIAALAGGASASASAASAPAGSAMSAGSSASPTADTYKLVTVTGAFGKAPKVKIPAVPGSGGLYIKTVIKGTGPLCQTGVRQDEPVNIRALSASRARQGSTRRDDDDR